MIIYLVKSTLLFGLLFIVYKLLLENEKMHRFNRFFLLFALAFGLWGPLISFDIDPEQSIAGINMQQMERAVNGPAEAVGKSVESVIIPKPDASAETEIVAPPDSPAEPGWSLGAIDLLFGLYGLITLFLFIRFAAGLFNILNKIKAGSYENAGPATLVLLDEATTPQSFFWFIFLDRKQFESGEIDREILDHELTHVRGLHSLDVLVVEFLKVILWFNPFIYLYKHSIQLNHEFIADDTVVGKGVSATDYQQMLIRVCAGTNPMRTTSSIGYSLTKKRLQMMVRSFSPFRSGSKTALILPLMGLLLIALGTERTVDNYLNSIPSQTYSVPELHYDRYPSEEAGVPYAAFTSSGELFTGTQKVYFTETDSLHRENYYDDGIHIETVYPENGEVSRQILGIYRNRYYVKEMYVNDFLIHKQVPPAESEDGMGHWLYWHRNGQLAFEVSYTGEPIDMEYQGLMTEYDEEGNITMQERYEDGELVETIK